MKFDALAFLRDFNIRFWEDGENVSSGWVNIKCPLCNDKSNHGGINPYAGYYYCWRCEWHPLEEPLSVLLNKSKREVKEILKSYLFTEAKRKLNKKYEVKRAKKVSLPSGENILPAKHKRYLLKRGFDPEKIRKQFHIYGVDYLGEFKFRIVLPIYWQGEVVSYTSRALYKNQSPRYKTASPEEEVIFHKDILYTNPSYKYGEIGIIVEGPTDVWAMETDTVATFGTSVTDSQLLEISKMFKIVFILFDPDAVKKANEIASKLSILGTKAYVIEGIKKDPGSMEKKEIKKLKMEIKKIYSLL